MARHNEPLSFGLWTAEDPALLKPGQLSDLRNAVYRPGTQALQRATGRSSFGTVSATAVDVDGLRDIKFDNGNHYLIAHASASYLSATVGDTGTFGVLATGRADGTQLEAVHYRNRFFLFNGTPTDITASAVNSNTVAYLSATAVANTPLIRQHGMNPVTAIGRLTATAGNWSITDTALTGYYEYWITEVARFTQDGAEFEMEGTYNDESGPPTINVTSTGMVPIIEFGPIQNPSATTHWRIYRSTKKNKETEKRFPTGFLIAEVATGTSATANVVTSHSDTLTVVSASAFPGSFNGVSDGATVYADFSNAARLSADDNSDATATAANNADFKRQGVYNFNFGGFAGSVRGIKVEIEALVDTGTVAVGVWLAKQRQSDGGILPANLSPFLRLKFGEAIRRTQMAYKSFVATTTRTVYTLGGENDRWFSSTVNPNIFNSNFMVVIGPFLPPSTKTLSVDFVRVTVYHSASIDTVIPFPTVVYTFGDTSAQVGKNGPPPSASTGDIFEDTLVTNDVDNPSIVRYSYPGDPEAFPSTYYIDFETEENDQIRLIKVVNQRCIVGLDSSIWRLNYLPSERDASFDRGKARVPISRSYGVVNPMCAVVFSMDGSSEQLAFVSNKGIHMTDGFHSETLTEGLNWRQVMPIGSSTAIALINDPENRELIYYFENTLDFAGESGNETFLALHLSYAADHIVDGKLKISGPVHLRNFHSGSSSFASLESAWSVPRANGGTGIYLGYGGSATAASAGVVMRETGNSIPSQDPAMQYTTRRMYLAGFGNEWRLNELYGYCAVTSGTQTLRYTPETTKTDSTLVTQGFKELTLASQRLHKIPLIQQAEGMRLKMNVTSGHSDLSCNFLVLDGTDFGMEDAGR